MKKIIEHHKFFVMASSKYINWNFKNGQWRRFLFHVIYYPIAYIKFMYYSYKEDNHD